MAVPEMLSFEDLQDILTSAPTGISAPAGVSAPPAMPQIEFMGVPTTVGVPSLVDAPAMPLGDVLGSQITYIERPENITYSPENLPEFMKDFEQISPTLFAPSQGVFAEAPVVDTIQPLMPQQYVDEYADLERAFQESIALDPTMFGGMYRSGIYMPTRIMGDEVPEDEILDFAGAAALAQTLSDIFPRIEKPEVDLPEIDLGEPKIDVPSIDVPELDLSFPEAGVSLEELEKSLQQQIIDPTEEVAKIVLDPVEDVAKIPLKVAEEAIKSFDIQTPEVSEGFLDKIIPDFSLPEIPDVVEESAQAVGEIINLIEDPSVKAAGEAIEQINIAGKEGGLEGDIISGGTETFVTTTAAGAAISDAIEDPSAANLAQAYEAVDYLTNTYAGTDLLSGEDLAGEFGSILSGIDVLEDGIDSPADAIAVSEAMQSISSLTGAQTAFDVSSSISSFLKPISSVHLGAEAINFADRALQGGAYGEYPNSSGSVSWDGSKFVSGESRGTDGASSTWGYAAQDSAIYGLNKLINNGFIVDSDKANEVLNSGVGNISSNSYYNTKENRSNSPQKVIYELLKSGAITPTENTPESVLKNTDSFNSYVTNLFNDVQNKHAKQVLDDYAFAATGLTGESMNKKQPQVPFATKSAAQRYVDDYGLQRLDVGDLKNKDGNFRSYELSEKKDGGYFLNPYRINFKGDSSTGTKTTFDSFGNKVKEEKIDGKYLWRGQSAEFNKVTMNKGGGEWWMPSETVDVFPYDPKYDGSGTQAQMNHQQYIRYMTGGFENRPIIEMPAKKTSALAKDAKLYMSDDDWNRFFV